MLSRAANAIYWMSRYLERADNVARFIQVNSHLVLDLGLDRGSAQWAPLVVTSGDEEDFILRYGEASEKNVIRFLTFDEENPNSILNCIRAARENARTVREVISTEMWETLNELYHTAQEESMKRQIDDLQGFYTKVRTSSHLFTGLAENTMSHDEGWHFARLGRMLERADKTARMLDVKYFVLLPSPDYVDSPYDSVEWGAVLTSANAFEMYRKQYHRVHYHNVAQFLMFDLFFPRSMAYCVDCAGHSLEKILGEQPMSDISALVEIGKLKETLLGTTLEKVLIEGLHEFIDRFQLDLNRVDEAIYESFFAPLSCRLSSDSAQA